MRHTVILCALAVAGCADSYAPRVAEAGPDWGKDLAACQGQSADSVDKRNAKTGLAWFSSPVRRPFQVRAAIRACLREKGYAVEG